MLVVFHYVFLLNRVSLDNDKGNNAENYNEDVADDCEDWCYNDEDLIELDWWRSFVFGLLLSSTLMQISNLALLNPNHVLSEWPSQWWSLW